MTVRKTGLVNPGRMAHWYSLLIVTTFFPKGHWERVQSTQEIAPPPILIFLCCSTASVAGRQPEIIGAMI